MTDMRWWGVEVVVVGLQGPKLSQLRPGRHTRRKRARERGRECEKLEKGFGYLEEHTHCDLGDYECT